MSLVNRRVKPWRRVKQAIDGVWRQNKSFKPAVSNPGAASWYWSLGHLLPSCTERINNTLFCFIYYLKLKMTRFAYIRYSRLWLTFDTNVLLDLENPTVFMLVISCSFVIFIQHIKAASWNDCLILNWSVAGGDRCFKRHGQKYSRCLWSSTDT